MDAATRTEQVEVERSTWTRRVLLWGLPAIVAVLGIWLYGSAGRYVSTDNAYLQQDRVDVVPQVSANVAQVAVAENTHVEAGSVILTLDDTLYRVAVAGAEAKLASARTDIAALKAAWRETGGEIRVAERAAELTDRDYRRQKELAVRKLISASALDTADRTREISTGATAVLELQRGQTAARLGGNAELPVDSYPEVKAALAELERARLDLEHTVIHAPQAGIVSHLPKIGSRVEVGRAAFALVSDRAIWVDANFKETDLEWVRAGEPVRVDIDTYGQHVWHGRVLSISQATGAEFSLLPAQNASGNWVKVVQRIPVRIQLERHADDPPLRDGMSANVEIDTGPHTRFDRWFGRDR